jgi:hypothetical protein
MQGIMLAIFSGILIFLVTVILLTMAAGDRIRMNNRLKQMMGQEDAAPPVRQPKQRSSSRIPVYRVFAQELSNAGIRMRPEEYLVFWLAAGIVPAGLLLLLNAHPITLVAATGTCMAIPPFIVFRGRKKRLVLF